MGNSTRKVGDARDRDRRCLVGRARAGAGLTRAVRSGCASRCPAVKESGASIRLGLTVDSVTQDGDGVDVVFTAG